MYNFKSLIASGLKTEKKPKTCEELNIVASSNKIKFWSAPPPRTLNPEAPSPALVTPGSNKIDLRTSTSPRTTGIFLMVEIESLLTLISGFLISVLALLSVMTTSCKAVSFPKSLKLFLIFLSRVMRSSIV
ncbi:hypothetical protein D3C80_1439820 [compost metagenome]